MSTEISHIKNMLKYNWEGPMWYGGHITAVLADITREKALRKPAAGAHNIYELVMHMLCWRNFVLELLKGNTSYKVEINSETDWPVKYEVTEESWKKTLAELENNQTELMAALENFEEAKLGEVVPERNFKWHVLLHGLIHHDIYHSGQIAILKK
jgi:uncharacterized damage-inducible protein DinB